MAKKVAGINPAQAKNDAFTEEVLLAIQGSGMQSEMIMVMDKLMSIELDKEK